MKENEITYIKTNVRFFSLKKSGMEGPLSIITHT
jgi:hypothetical protein